MHEESTNAIKYALTLSSAECHWFLSDWNVGDLSNWPEYSPLPEHRVIYTCDDEPIDDDNYGEIISNHALSTLT